MDQKNSEHGHILGNGRIEVQEWSESEMVHEITISIEFLLIPGSALVYNYNIWYLIIISDVVLTSSCKEVYVT